MTRGSFFDANYPSQGVSLECNSTRLRQTRRVQAASLRVIDTVGNRPVLSLQAVEHVIWRQTLSLMLQSRLPELAEFGDSLMSESAFMRPRRAVRCV